MVEVLAFSRESGKLVGKEEKLTIVAEVGIICYSIPTLAL